jgi:hypothetical protein
MGTILLTLAIGVMLVVLLLMGILLLNMVAEEWESLKENLKAIWTKNRKETP